MKHTNISLTTVLMLAVLALPLSFTTQAKAQSPAAPSTIVGTVSCLACRGTCPRKAETLWSCTLRNVRSGSPYVLVVGDQLYLLKGNTADLDKFAGGKAAVRGQIEGTTIIAQSVSDVKTASKVEAASK